jgi:hypothetical protein
MDRKRIAVLPLIVLAIANPVSLYAKDSNRSISYHLSAATNRIPALHAVFNPLIDKEIARSRAVDAVVNLPEAPYHARLLAGANVPKEKSFSYNWGDGAIMFGTARTKSLRNIYGSKLSGINRFSVAEAKIGIFEEIGPRDSLAFSASYGLERRRLSLFLGRHNVSRSQDVAFTSSWTHDDQFRLGISGFDTHPNKTRNDLERIVELGGGAPLTVRGLAVAASLSPTHNFQAFSIGLDVRQQQHSAHDAAVIGALVNRSETRWALVLHRSF